MALRNEFLWSTWRPFEGLAGRMRLRCADCSHYSLVCNERHRERRCELRPTDELRPDMMLCASHSSLSGTPARKALGPLLEVSGEDLLPVAPPPSRDVARHLHVVRGIAASDPAELSLPERCALFELLESGAREAAIELDRIQTDFEGITAPLAKGERVELSEMVELVTPVELPPGWLLARLSFAGRVVGVLALLAAVGAPLLCIQLLGQDTTSHLKVLLVSGATAASLTFWGGLSVLERMGLSATRDDREPS